MMKGKPVMIDNFAYLLKLHSGGSWLIRNDSSFLDPFQKNIAVCGRAHRGTVNPRYNDILTQNFSFKLPYTSKIPILSTSGMFRNKTSIA